MIKAEESPLAETCRRLDVPFRVSMSGSALDEILAMCAKTGGHLPRRELAKALGLLRARVLRGDIEVPGRPLDPSVETRAHDARIFGVAVGYPTLLKAVAKSLKHNPTVDDDLFAKALSLCDHGAIVDLCRISYFKAASLADPRRASAACTEILKLVGHSNSSVQIKAATALARLDMRFRTGLLPKAISELEADLQRPAPNPRWVPGLLTLCAASIYWRAPGLDLEKILEVASRYVLSRSDPPILTASLLVLWAISRAGGGDPVLLRAVLELVGMLAIFAEDRGVRRTAATLATGLLGERPDPNGLFIMDRLNLTRSRSAKDTFRLIKAMGISGRLLSSYARRMLVDEEHPRRKLGAALLKKHGELRNTIESWNFSSPDVPVRSGGLELALKLNDPSTDSELLGEIQMSDKVFSKPRAPDVVDAYLRLALRASSLPSSAYELLLYSAKKNMHMEGVLRCVIKHSPCDLRLRSFLMAALKKNPRSPGVIMCGSLLAGYDEAVGPLLFRMLEGAGPVREAALAGLFWVASKTGNAYSPVVAQRLLGDLECYEVDPRLGDVGSFRREDSLLLLTRALVSKSIRLPHKALHKEAPRPAQLVFQLLGEGGILPLSERDTHAVMASLIKFTIDKSRRLALFILDQLAPSFFAAGPRQRDDGTKKLLRMVGLVWKRYRRDIRLFPAEDSILNGAFELLTRVASNKTRPEEMNLSHFVLSSTITGLASNLLSCDGCLYRKLVSRTRALMQSRPRASELIREAIRDIRPNSRLAQRRLEEVAADLDLN